MGLALGERIKVVTRTRALTVMVTLLRMHTRGQIVKSVMGTKSGCKKWKRESTFLLMDSLPKISSLTFSVAGLCCRSQDVQSPARRRCWQGLRTRWVDRGSWKLSNKSGQIMSLWYTLEIGDRKMRVRPRRNR